MKKWRPCDRPAEELCTAITQAVLPESFRKEVLHLAHEVSMVGHLGVRKAQEKILRHFFWPKLHEDVVACCHACQVVGKPNQKIPVAPVMNLHLYFYIVFFILT